MNRFLSSLIGVCLLTVGGQAVAQNALFRDIAYGAPASDFTAAQGYYDCSEDAGTPALCIDDVTFLQEPFDLVLRLSDGVVTSVVAVAGFSEAVYGKLVGALLENFTLVALEDKRGVFDVLERAHAATSDRELTSELTKFESFALNEGQLTYYFVELPGDALKPHRSATELIRSMPSDARQADLIVTEDQDGAYAMVNFSFPAKDIERLQSNMEKAKKEKF